MAQTEKPLICSDPYADARFSRHFDDESGFRTRSILCVPLKSRDRLMGVVEVINKQEAQGFTGEDLEILTMLGNMIGPALENAQLYSRLKEKLSLTREELKVVENKLLQTEASGGPGQTLLEGWPTRCGIGHDHRGLYPPHPEALACR